MNAFQPDRERGRRGAQTNRHERGRYGVSLDGRSRLSIDMFVRVSCFGRCRRNATLFSPKTDPIYLVWCVYPDPGRRGNAT